MLSLQYELESSFSHNCKRIRDVTMDKSFEKRLSTAVYLLGAMLLTHTPRMMVLTGAKLGQN